LERAKLDASKAEVVSEIEGAKSRIDVGISEGELSQVKTTVKSHKTSQEADLERLEQQKDKVVRDMERSKGYLSKMVLRAPNDGIVNVLPNFRTQGSWGQSPPPFKEGDRAWTGAAIAEIPDLSEMRIDLKLEEVERGKLRLGMPIRIRVDAIPDQELEATLDWISPIAAVVWRGMGMTDKTFPARGTLKKVDPRLRPGMSATAEILIESEAASLLIPARASFMNKGKPSVWVQRGSEFVARPIEVGKRNDSDLVVKSGLKEGDVIALENPAEALKRAKKL
jgi:HlyD family secretion protein